MQSMSMNVLLKMEDFAQVLDVPRLKLKMDSKSKPTTSKVLIDTPTINLQLLLRLSQESSLIMLVLILMQLLPNSQLRIPRMNFMVLILMDKKENKLLKAVANLL